MGGLILIGILSILWAFINILIITINFYPLKSFISFILLITL